MSCVKCKKNPIWKGSKKYHIRNFWGLYCINCEENISEEFRDYERARSGVKKG